jgi:hypothetical protein
MECHFADIMMQLKMKGDECVVDKQKYGVNADELRIKSSLKNVTKLRENC